MNADTKKPWCFSERNENVIAGLVHQLSDTNSPVAVHAGHFMLLREEADYVPSVLPEQNASMPACIANPIRQALHEFSIGTWRMGVELVSRLRKMGRQADLLILVNDWQYVRNSITPNASEMRASFYEANPKVLPSYQEVLHDFGLTEEAIMSLGSWKPFISESWLRRRINRRLKRMKKSRDQASSKLSIEHTLNGQEVLVYDDFGQACQLLVCGQADCAGEVMELVYQLHQNNYRQFVNIIPSECENPVNEGIRRAISLFDMADFSSLNAAFPCLSAGNRNGHTARRARFSRVYGDRIDGCGVDALVESIDIDSGLKYLQL